MEYWPDAFREAVRMKTKLPVWRAEKEWTQADLADAVGVSRQCINAIETGKYEPGLLLAYKIVRLFGKTIEETFLYEDEVRSSKRKKG